MPGPFPSSGKVPEYRPIGIRSQSKFFECRIVGSKIFVCRTIRVSLRVRPFVFSGLARKKFLGGIRPTADSRQLQKTKGLGCVLPDLCLPCTAESGWLDSSLSG